MEGHDDITQIQNDPTALLCELLLTDSEVARLLRVSVDTVLNLHRTGQLRARKIGKHNRWTPATVQAFAASPGGDDGN